MANILRAQGANFIFLGSFNPKIVSPVWLLSKELISEQWALTNDTNPSFFTDDFSSFKCGEFQIQVTLERFSLSVSLQTEFDMMKDLAIGIFTVLSETPVKQMGVNFLSHTEIVDVDVKKALKTKLSQFQILDNLCERASISSLVVEGKNPWQEDGKLRMNIQPSVVYNNAIYTEINNHFELEKIEDWKEFLSANWNQIRLVSNERASKISKILE